MYFINNLKKGLWLLLAIAVMAIQTSCEKDDNLGAPVITGLRAISPAPDDSTLSFVTPGQVVVLQGRNFNGAQQLYFSGYPATINPALNTNNTMVISVPSEIIFTGLDPEKANTIKLVTNHGVTVFDFSIIPPPPVINAISNEFAKEGNSITLRGSYLYTVKEVTFPGGIAVTNGFSSSADGSSMQVTVPSGITPGKTDSITVITNGGQGRFPFYNTTGMLANFEDGDPDFGWQYWGGIKANDASKFPGGWGNYIEIIPPGPINAKDNSWWTNNRAVMIDSSEWKGVDISDPPANYALKFQMYVKEPWVNGSLSVIIDGDGEYRADYAPWKNTANGQFMTNGWITVTIMLTDFKNGDGESAASVSDLTNGAPGNQVQIMLYNNGETAITSFDAAFDNVRVVKIK